MRSKKGDSGAHAAVLLTLGIIVLTSTIGGFIAFNVARVSGATFETSKAKLHQVTTSLRVLELLAQKSAPRELSYIYELVELSHSSREGMRVDEIKIILNLRDQTAVYNFSPNINCSLNPTANFGIDSLSNASNTGHFGANSRINANTPRKYDGYITRFNVAKLCFTTPRPLVEDEKVTIKLVPDRASALVTTVTLPMVFTTDYVRLLEHVA